MQIYSINIRLYDFLINIFQIHGPYEEICPIEGLIWRANGMLSGPWSLDQDRNKWVDLNPIPVFAKEAKERSIRIIDREYQGTIRDLFGRPRPTQFLLCPLISFTIGRHGRDAHIGLKNIS